MSQSTVPVLPLDIIENIIDILINDDANGLQYVTAFSLVCQSFLPFCRKHIFSSIHIKLDDSYTHPLTGNPYSEAFGRLLLKTPAIAKYVRHLNICIIRQDIIRRSYAGSGYLFGQVPRQLTRLQSLTIWHSHYPHNDWNNNSSSMQRSLLNLMHLPTLSHLNLRWISNFPISELITCTNLKHLSVEEFHITGEDEQAASLLLHKPIQLQSFHILYINRA